MNKVTKLDSNFIKSINESIDMLIKEDDNFMNNMGISNPVSVCCRAHIIRDIYAGMGITKKCSECGDLCNIMQGKK